MQPTSHESPGWRRRSPPPRWLQYSRLLARAQVRASPRHRRPAFKESRRLDTCGARGRGASRRWWQAFGDPQLEVRCSCNRRARICAPRSPASSRRARRRGRSARCCIRRSMPALLPRAGAILPRRDGRGPRRHRQRLRRVAGSLVGDRPVRPAAQCDRRGERRSGERRRPRRGRSRPAGRARDDYFSLRGADAELELLEDTVEPTIAPLSSPESLSGRHCCGDRRGPGRDAAAERARATRLRASAARAARARDRRADRTDTGRLLAGGRAVCWRAATARRRAAFDAARAPSRRRGAERPVAAANAEIGVARAAWFPVFGFGARGGYEAPKPQSGSRRRANFGPPGRRHGADVRWRRHLGRQARGTRAYDEAVANYRQSALVAYREVEDNLAALHHLADEVTSEEAAAASAQRSAYHADRRYAAGVADYIEVASTQTPRSRHSDPRSMRAYAAPWLASDSCVHWAAAGHGNN